MNDGGCGPGGPRTTNGMAGAAGAATMRRALGEARPDVYCLTHDVFGLP